MEILQTIWNFICDHYHAIAEFGLLICVLFVTIFKKKVKINDVLTTVLTVLPDIISLAENRYSVGSEKYSFVFNKCIEMLRSLTHWSRDKVLSEYTADLDHAIESILSTPQKKER